STSARCDDQARQSNLKHSIATGANDRNVKVKKCQWCGWHTGGRQIFAPLVRLNRRDTDRGKPCPYGPCPCRARGTLQPVWPELATVLQTGTSPVPTVDAKN